MLCIAACGHIGNYVTAKLGIDIAGMQCMLKWRAISWGGVIHLAALGMLGRNLKLLIMRTSHQNKTFIIEYS